MIRSFVILAIVTLAACGSGSSSACSGDACCICGGTAVAGCTGVAVGTYSSSAMMTTCATSTLNLADIQLDVAPGVLATISFDDSGTQSTSTPMPFSCTDKTTLQAKVSTQGCSDTLTFELTPMGPTQVALQAKLDRTCPPSTSADFECTSTGVLTRPVN